MKTITPHGKITVPDTHQRGKYYVLYDPSIQHPPLYYKDILAKAQQSIRILDPYALKNDAIDIFQEIKQDEITIDIITTNCEKNVVKQFADNIKNILVKSVNTFKLTIYSFNKRFCSKDKISLWHDRYLIIDDRDYFLVGSSIDAQVKSDCKHGVYQLTETNDKEIVAKLYHYYYTNYNSSRAFKTTREK